MALQRSWLLSLLVSTVKGYAIFMLDPTGHVMTWNAGAQRLKYYTEEEIVGRHFSAFYSEVDKAAGKPEMELRVATDQGSMEDEGWRLGKYGTNVIITAVCVTHSFSRFSGAAWQRLQLCQSLTSAIKRTRVQLSPVPERN